MFQNPKVSIILTSYNHAKYLPEAIDSAINQTFSDFELIIWDDASSDNSWEIIQKYNDKRIKTFRNDEQMLGRYGINKAIKEISRGEYIAIHHSDDIWQPEKLEKQIAFLETNQHIGAVFTDVLVIDENSNPLPENFDLYQNIFSQPNRSRHEWLNHFFYKGNALAHPSVLIRTKCYTDCGLYRYGFPAADYDMWVRLCMKYEIHVLSEKLLKIRVFEDKSNLSGNRQENRQRGYFQYLQILRNYSKITHPEELGRIFPAAKKYITPNGFVPSFVLAMAALEAPQTHNILKLFGLELLFELMNKGESKRQVEEIYGFKSKNFLEIVGRYDIFSFEITNQLRSIILQKDALLAEKDTLLAEKNTLLAEKDTLLAERYNYIQEITSSKGWKLVLLLRKIRVKLLPPKKVVSN